MRETMTVRIIPAGLAVVGLGVLWFWWSTGPRRLLQERVPGADRASAGATAGAATQWQGKLIKGGGSPASLAGVWGGFRGSDRTGITVDPTPLSRAWPEGGPKVLWHTDVGEGFAAAAIWKGRVFLLDYDHQAQADALRCLSLADGQEVWRYTYPSKVKRNHGMSRTIPAVTEHYVVSLGPKCQVVCLDPLSGTLRWQMDLVREFNAEVPPWYAGQCPLIDGDRLILATGGDALLVAVELATGKVLWKAPNPHRWQMTHSSVTAFDFGGRRQYAYCGSGGVAGVAAADGALLWETPDWKISIANVPSPVDIGAGRLFLCGGYNAGSLMLQLSETNGACRVAPLFRLKPAVYGATQQTPLLYQNHLFGVRPDGQLVCLDLEGKTVWASGAAHRFGNGPFLLAQGLLFVMNDEGVLTLAEAATSGYRQLAQAKILPGPDAWGPLALADGRLIARDMTRMVCLEVRAP